MSDSIGSILGRHGPSRTGLLDILWDVQHLYGHIPGDVLPAIGASLSISALDVWETASFYHFFTPEPSGKYRIYLSDTVTAKLRGYQSVHDALERETGTRFGGTDPTGTFGLFETPCIGLSDQEPAMLLDHVAFTRLTPEKVARIVGRLKQGESPVDIANPMRWPSAEVTYVDALVESNVRTAGPVFFEGGTDYPALLADCVARTPEQTCDLVTHSGLRGRGGAGFATGVKWRLCREAADDDKYVIGNADEGEPGTFKDRVLLTRSPQQVFVGMVIAAYAIGSSHGILYLRAEYFYLKDYLEGQLEELRANGLLGRNIGGRSGFDFDIRIQMGAGSYVCGDESALIESCEGKRGTPRIKPPFPVHRGYLGHPTCVNNVETLAAATQVLRNGPEWFAAMGTPASSGTRLLSVAGDCQRPGIYEVEWGVSLGEVLGMVGAEDARAVQVSGPSGECVSAERDAHRLIAHEDLSCNGAVTIFNSHRDLLGIVEDFMRFFATESCGICVPCRAGNVELQHKVQLVRQGRAGPPDLLDLATWGEVVRQTSRCGHGATSPNPIASTLASFPEVYQERLHVSGGALLPSYDAGAAVAEHEKTVVELRQRDAR